MSIETIYCIGYVALIGALAIGDFLYSRRVGQ